MHIAKIPNRNARLSFLLREAVPERSAPTRLERDHPAMTPHSGRTYFAVPYSERD
jgi:hypothetical protein